VTIRVAAVGDLHMRPAVRGHFRPAFTALEADFLLLAGDLTNGGTPEEAEILCAEIAGLPLPQIAVLGNHDHDADYGAELAAMLTAAGVTVLDGTHTTLDVNGTSVGVAGIMGGGGGFPGYPTRPNATPEQLVRLRRGAEDAERLQPILSALSTDITIALTHFAPITETLAGEPTEIYWGLGCDALGTAIDKAGADLVIHGHAHSGTETGRTPGGIPVRNVAHPVLRRPCAIYEI
jgi:Icc-related predicted phosphoesterase